jgi:hypothetical protein
MQEEDLVQVTLECPNLDFPIRLPLMQMNQLTSELLLTEIERVLQSNELAQHMSSLFCIWMMQRLSFRNLSVPT